MANTPQDHAVGVERSREIPSRGDLVHSAGVILMLFGWGIVCAAVVWPLGLTFLDERFGVLHLMLLLAGTTYILAEKKWVEAVAIIMFCSVAYAGTHTFLGFFYANIVGAAMVGLAVLGWGYHLRQKHSNAH